MIFLNLLSKSAVKKKVHYQHYTRILLLTPPQGGTAQARGIMSVETVPEVQMAPVDREANFDAPPVRLMDTGYRKTQFIVKCK